MSFHPKSNARRAIFLLCLAGVSGAALATQAAAAQGYGFTMLDNPGDPLFTQLLGINDRGVIVGYFGDGTKRPNKGFALLPPAGFTAENFPDSVQTQVVAIDDHPGQLRTAGFWVDAAGNNYGFVSDGSSFTSVADPKAQPFNGVTVNQLLGFNDRKQAVGFYVDGDGNSHGYVYSLQTRSFNELTLPPQFGAVSVVATGINDSGTICGFYTDGALNTHGFIIEAAGILSLDEPNGNGTNTQLLGINKYGVVAGSFVDAGGGTHGVVYDQQGAGWTQIDHPQAKQHAAFNVSGTVVNGINQDGDLVGFYSDGRKVHGFLAAMQ